MKGIRITKENIEELNHLPDDLEILHCMNLNLTDLPKLPETLKVLYCGYNLLTVLPELPKTLEFLHCSSNRFKKLPELPKSLEKFYCGDNEITMLPELPDTLTEFVCYNNKLKELPELPKSLESFDCDGNPFECPLDKDIIEKFQMSIDILYTKEKKEQYITPEYQLFLLENYIHKFADIVYNFKELGIEFHDEVKQKYDHLFTGLQYNLI